MPPRKPPDLRQGRGTADVGLVEVGAANLPIPPPPSSWLVGTRNEWAAFWQSDTAELVAPQHHSAVQRLFEWRDLFTRALRDAKAFRVKANREPFIEGSQGQPRLNPLFDQADKAAAYAVQCEGAIRQLEDRFGLSIGAQLKLGVTFQQRQNLEALNAQMWEAQGAGSDVEDDPRAAGRDAAVEAG